MASNDVGCAIDKNRDVEAEALDAFGNLTDLLLAMDPSIARIGCEMVNRNVTDRKRFPRDGLLNRLMLMNDQSLLPLQTGTSVDRWSWKGADR